METRLRLLDALVLPALHRVGSLIISGYENMTKRALHEIYIGSALVLVIATLMGVKWDEVPKLADYVTFSSSIVSIILALLAIAYAFMSNAGMEKHLESFSTAITRIDGAVSNISDLTRRVSDDVKGTAGAITSEVARVNERVKGLEQGASFRSQLNPSDKEHDDKFDDDKPVSFIQQAEQSSLLGVMLSYVCVYCYEKQRIFDLDQLAKATKLTAEYMQGYLIASAAAGQIELIEKKERRSLQSLK